MSFYDLKVIEKDDKAMLQTYEDLRRYGT